MWVRCLALVSVFSGVTTGVVCAAAERESVRDACTQQAAEAGLTNPGDILEYVAECVSLLSQNNEPAQDIEASAPHNPPQN